MVTANSRRLLILIRRYKLMPQPPAPMPYEAVKISDGAWRIEDNGVRAFVFEGTKNALVVDTGFGTGDLRMIVDGLTSLPIILVNTHADADHISCNTQFGTAHMHPAEYPYYYETAKQDATVAPLWDGDVIDIGGRKFEVILIPGHTPGSIALLDRENKILVSGDSVSATPVFMFGKVRNIRAFIASLEKLLTFGDAFDTVYPSHGPFPVSTDLIGSAIAGAKKVLAGEVEGQDPPFELPAKMYLTEGAAFFY
jgi:glyoxylase-like metal-dependent hydrolase (beta-lactamase superfamily II)